MRVLWGVVVALAFAQDQEIELVRDLVGRYNIKYAVILFDDEMFNRALEIGKIIMESFGITVTVNSIQTHIDNLEPYRVQDGVTFTLFYLLLTEKKTHLEKVSQKIKMEGSVWLIFLSPETVLEDLFGDVKLVYNMDMLVSQRVSDGSFNLYDVYRVTLKHPIRVIHYGCWSEKLRLRTAAPIRYYRRRQNLEGINIRVAVKDSPPNHKVVFRDNRYYYEGILGIIWKDMELMFNFTSSLILYNDLDPDGITGMMKRENIDAALVEATMSTARCMATYCLRPIIASRNQLYFKGVGFETQWNAILRPFHLYSWLIIFLWFIVTGFCLNIFFRIGRRYRLERPETDFNFLNSFLSVFSAFCQRESFVVPDSIPCRIIFFMLYIVANILFTVYSATLVSYLSLTEPFRPFSNLRELLNDGSYTILPVQGSFLYNSFANSTDAFSQRVFKELMAVTPPNALPKTKMEALERVCRNEKLVYMGMEFTTKRYVQELNKKNECGIIGVEKPLNVIYVTILLSRSSNFKELFNQQLNAYSYSGIFDKLIRYTNEDITEDADLNFVSVGIHQLQQIFVLLAAGIFLSLVVFLAEIVTSQRSKRKQNRFSSRRARRWRCC